MRYAEFLPEKGTIGLVAPSFGCNIEPYRTAFAHAQEKWRSMGYRLELGPNCHEGKGTGISNSPQACGRELTEYYCSRENDCLISCGGGELMCEILDEVDFDAIRKAPPKWFMGFSDNTNFTYLLATMCDTAAVYGPCAAAFGMEPWHASLHDSFGLLTGRRLSVEGYPLWEKESLKNEEHPTAAYNVTEKRLLKCFTGTPGDAVQSQDVPAGCLSGDAIPPVTIRGRLLGGCMDCLINLLGTQYDKTREFAEKYQEEGIIWFLEACDLNVFSIRRAMWQMAHAGWFRYVKGFLIGRPLCYGQEMMGLDAYQAVLDTAARYQVPVIMDVDLGHLPPMMPLIVGSLGTVKVHGNHIRVEMELR